MMKHEIAITVIALLALLMPSAPVSAGNSDEDALQKQASEIYELVMCPLCAGQTIGQSKNETSSQMRDLVLKKLRRGESKAQILHYFESRYGERILATPTKKGFNLVLWVLPLVLVALAAIVIYFMIRRWSARQPMTPASRFDENRSSGYQERLEKELKRFGEEL